MVDGLRLVLSVDAYQEEEEVFDGQMDFGLQAANYSGEYNQQESGKQQKNTSYPAQHRPSPPGRGWLRAG